MYEFLKWTAWGMTPPKFLGTFHILFLVFGLSACVFGAWLLRKTTKKQTKIILFSIGLFLLIAEVYKQLFYTYFIGAGKYQWWIFPFQLCSIPMYLCLIVPFIKNDKICGYIYTFLATYNLVGGFVSVIEQSGLSHPYITLTLHAYIWHYLLVFIGFYLIACGRANVRKKEIVSAIIFFFILSLIAQFFNTVFKDTGMNMFYISPFRNTPLAVFKTIQENYGWFVNVILYVSALTLGAFVFLVSSIGIRKIPKKITTKKGKV